MDDDAIMVVDGEDFVATAAYVVKPRAPLSWLDPGVFGTLGGVEASLGAALRNPGQEVWLIWGDGSSRIPWPNLTRFFVISFRSLLW